VPEPLLAPASGSDRSHRSVDPQTGIGARASQINGPRPDRTRTKVGSWPLNTQSRILTPRSAGHRVHTERGTGVRIGHGGPRYPVAGAAGTRRECASSFFAARIVRVQASRWSQRALLKVRPPAVRIDSDSYLEVEPRVLIQIEFAIEPRRGIERLHLLRSVNRPHPPAVGNWLVNPPTREPIVKRG
jgi:hypothetical protein